LEKQFFTELHKKGCSHTVDLKTAENLFIWLSEFSSYSVIRAFLNSTDANKINPPYKDMTCR